MVLSIQIFTDISINVYITIATATNIIAYLHCFEPRCLLLAGKEEPPPRSDPY